MPVIEQLQKFGETQRGWLGVKIQPVTDQIAETLGVKPPRGALIGEMDEKGPAKLGGLETGDVIVKFDGKDVKESKDLPRIVADTTVGKEVDVLVIRKGKEETKKITVQRLAENDAPVKAAVRTETPAPQEKTVTQRALGIDLAGLSRDLRTRFKIRDTVKGVVVMSVEPNSDAAEKRLGAGDVIVEVAQEAVNSAQDVQTRVDAAQEGRQEIGAAAGRQCQWRVALRRAGIAVIGHSGARACDEPGTRGICSIELPVRELRSRPE